MGGGPGRGASRSLCTTYASGESIMYKASRLIYSFFAYTLHTYVQQAGSALLQATHQLTFLCLLQTCTLLIKVVFLQVYMCLSPLTYIIWACCQLNWPVTSYMGNDGWKAEKGVT